jgi:hypothetical protein
MIGLPPPTLSEAEFGIGHQGYLRREKRKAYDEAVTKWDEICSQGDDGKHGQYPTWETLGRRNLATETFKYLGTRETLEPFLSQCIGEMSGPKPKLYRLQQMSPRQFETAHLVPGEHALPVHPSQPGLHTGSLNDQKLLQVLWLKPFPEDGDLHPPEPKMVDGRLIAVWRTSTERSCSPELLKKFKRMQGRVADRLSGNKAALERNVIKRVVGGLKWRYHSFFRGGKEGIATPRNKGRIAAVVFLVSVPTSVGIYAIVYGIQYNAVKHEMYQMRSQKADAAGLEGAPSPAPPPYPAQAPSGPPPPPYNAAAPAYPAPPAYAGPSGNGSISLSA